MHRTILAVILFLGLLPAAAYAQQSFESSFMIYNFDFREDCPPPLKSTEEAWLLGSHLAYQYLGEKNNIYGRLLFEYARANTDYDGTDQQGTPLVGTTLNTFFTGEADIGYRFALSRHSHLIPYAGFGYRFRNRDLGAYSEEYDWQYVPLGLRIQYQPHPRWEMALDIALRFVVNASVKVNLSEISTSIDDAEANLQNDIGFYIALPITYRFDSRWSLALTPWYEDIDMGACSPFPITNNGETIGSAYVPESEARMYGANIGVVFEF